MTETSQPLAPAQHDEGPHFGTYISIFAVLCVLTAVSFVVNAILGQNHTSMAIILGVAVVKAFCVALIFMHLKFDFGRVYFIIIPVAIISFMMIIVLLPDIVLAWHQ